MRIGGLLILAILLPLTSRAAEFSERPAPLLVKIGEHRLLTSRQGAAAVAFGEHVYILGGSDAGMLGDIERLNVRTGKIEQVCDTLIPRRYHRAIEFEGRIFIFGGQSDGATTTPFVDTVEVYDPVKKSVTRVSKMPHPRSHIAAACVGSLVFLAGGAESADNQTRQTGRLDIYDLKQNAWRIGPAIPTVREAPAVANGNAVFVPGGFRPPGALPTVEMFVPQQNVWKSLPPLSRAVSAHSLALLGDRIFLFGDYTRLDSVLAYELKTHRTVDVAVNFRGFRHTAAAVLDGKIYVIGGNVDSSTPPTDLIQVFALAPKETR